MKVVHDTSMLCIVLLFMRIALHFMLPSAFFFALHSFTTKDELGKAGPLGQMGDSSESFSAPEDEAPREYQSNDSDSDGPILYTDDDEEEDDDDDGSGESKKFSKK